MKLSLTLSFLACMQAGSTIFAGCVCVSVLAHGSLLEQQFVCWVFWRPG